MIVPLGAAAVKVVSTVNMPYFVALSRTWECHLCCIGNLNDRMVTILDILPEV